MRPNQASYDDAIKHAKENAKADGLDRLVFFLESHSCWWVTTARSCKPNAPGTRVLPSGKTFDNERPISGRHWTFREWLDHHDNAIEPMKQEADEAGSDYDDFDEAYDEHVELLHPMIERSDPNLLDAAPDLLRELKASRDELIKLRDNHLSHTAAVVRALIQHRIWDADKAIAKAEGTEAPGS